MQLTTSKILQTSLEALLATHCSLPAPGHRDDQLLLVGSLEGALNSTTQLDINLISSGKIVTVPVALEYAIKKPIDIHLSWQLLAQFRRVRCSSRGSVGVVRATHPFPEGLVITQQVEVMRLLQQSNMTMVNQEEREPHLHPLWIYTCSDVPARLN